MKLAFIDDFKPAVITAAGATDVSDIVRDVLGAGREGDSQGMLLAIIGSFSELGPKMASAAAKSRARPLSQSG